MKEFVLDASFALCWCFEDESTKETEFVLTELQNQAGTALVPGIWRFEVLNGLGKAIARGRLDRLTGLRFWQEIQALPIVVLEIPANAQLLELALEHNLAVYDASYLSMSIARKLPLATVDRKLQQAAESGGIEVIGP